MKRYFSRWQSETLVSLQSRNEQQHDPRSVVKLILPNDQAELALYDLIEPNETSVRLHRGLGIDVYNTADREVNAVKAARGIVETVLGLVTFCTLSPCKPALLLRVYDATVPGPSRRPFSHRTYFLNQPRIARLQVLDPQLFGSVFEQLHFLKQRGLRSLLWFRKGLAEEFTLDEFIAYWVALENLASDLKEFFHPADEKTYSLCPDCRNEVKNCPLCKYDLGKPSVWSGVFHLLNASSVITRREFNLIRKRRGALLHGGRTIDEEFVTEIRESQVPKLRKLLIHTLAALLRLKSETAEIICDKVVSRIVVPSSIRIVGNLRLEAKAPPDIDQVNLQPVLGHHLSEPTYTLNKEGKIMIHGKAKHTFHHAVFAIDSVELWGDENTGVSSAELSIE